MTLRPSRPRADTELWKAKHDLIIHADLTAPANIFIHTSHPLHQQRTDSSRHRELRFPRELVPALMRLRIHPPGIRQRLRHGDGIINGTKSSGTCCRRQSCGKQLLRGKAKCSGGLDGAPPVTWSKRRLYTVAFTKRGKFLRDTLIEF